MSKILILGDCHIGARLASPIVASYQIKYFKEELFPYILKHNINTILQVGDLFDTRKFSNHIIIQRFKRELFDWLEEHNIHLITLVGNHDSAFKDKLTPNTQSLLLGEYKNITIISEPTEMDILDMNFLLLPWICSSNKERTMQMIEDTECLYCAGHLELLGFDYQKGIEANGGEDAKDFEKFDMVFSGHYHTSSKKNNILYIGTPYELTSADYGDQKYVYVFDTKTHKILSVKTKSTIFKRIEYDDKDIEPILPKDLENTYVKVVVINKTDPAKFDKFITSISIQNPADLKISDMDVDFSKIDFDSDDIDIEDTPSLITKFIDDIDTDLDKPSLKLKMQSLYITAMDSIE